MSTKGVRAVVSSATYRRVFAGQPARKTAHPTGRILCVALKYLSPCTQSHRVGQAQAGDRPGQRPDPANIPVDCSKKNGLQRFQKVVIHLVGFIHGGTSTNPYNRLRSLIPLFEDSYCFLSCLKFVSQPGIWVENEVMAALEKEQQHPKPVLFPIKLDELVMQTSLPWAASIRR